MQSSQHNNAAALGTFAGPRRSATKLAALALLAGSSIAMGQGTLVPIPGHSSIYNGYTRGYNFTANTSFVISRLELPPEAMQVGDTAGFLVRVNGNVILRDVGNVQAHIDTAIFVGIGDVVDIMGNWSPATTGSFTAHNSYAPSGIINTTIEGVAHELSRTGWQWDIADPAWESGSYVSPSSGQAGRVFMYTIPPSNDPGGCCFADGSCQLLSILDCNAQGGAFRGFNTDCVDPCPQPGACCFPDGSCDFMLEATCTSGGGTWAGAAVTCVQANCPQPPVGACCFGDGTCQVIWEPGCLSQGGNYQGDGTDCATITCPLNIETSFAGTSSTTGAGAGAYFRITALDPQGLVIDSFDINSAAAAGTAITAHVYAKPGDFEGFETDPSAWILLGEVATTAAGIGNPTPVAIGGLHILNGETWSLRVGAANGGIRYTGSSTPPTYANSHVQLEMGKVQTGLFAGSLFGTATSLRGWDGRIWYSLGANVTTGACCLPDGTCDTIREIFCNSAGGVYNGDGTDCATIPPCPIGACCFIDGSCSMLAQAGCDTAGGSYQGDGTDCATANCPQPGACCIPSGCIVLSEGECLAFGGEFRGGGTECATANCPPPTVSNIIGFNFTTAASTNPDPQNWNRISSAIGSLANVMDDAGIVTPVGIEWSGGVGGNGFLFLATSTLAPDAVPQHTYDLAGMTGYGYRSTSADHTLVLSGLTPGAEYQYWFVGYRSTSAIENVVQVSEGDTINAIIFTQSITSAANNGRFIVNETIADNTMHWDTLARSTTSSSSGTLTINWAGNGQTPVIGAFAIREVLGQQCYANCDGSTNEPILNVDDFTCFINEFAAAQALPHEQQVSHYANCDGSTNAPVLNVDDFTCFINEFAAGCP